VSSLATAATWFTSTVSGPIVTSLLTIAVALLGFSMLSGRLPLRRACEIILGCFLLVGATGISTSMLSFLPTGVPPSIDPEPVSIEVQALPPLGPDPAPSLPTGNPFDPYAGQQSVQ
jgi:hypothetical protein